MNIGNPVESLAKATYSAIAVDLNPVSYPQYQTIQDKKDNKPPTYREARPSVDQLHIYHFLQTWGSTALGFNNMGGSAMTSAYTTVIIHKDGQILVYFNGDLAYKLKDVNSLFKEDLGKHYMADVERSSKYQAI